VKLGIDSETLDFSGRGPVVVACVTLEHWFSGAVVLSRAVGYRYAKISTVKLEGETGYNDDGSKFAFDYSGPFVRLALKVSLQKESPDAGKE
jgi:hypothetical protein